MSAANFQSIFQVLAVLALVAYGLVALAVLWCLAGVGSSRVRGAGTRVRTVLSPFSLVFAWLVSMIAMSGSLYLSEVVGLIPCRLCWYQRIAMYPLVFLLAIAVFRNDRQTARRYLAPMAAVGAFISTYHYQLERFPNQTELVCSAEAPCSVPVVNVWGFASVPFMALAAFLLIITALALGRGRGRNRDAVEPAPG